MRLEETLYGNITDVRLASGIGEIGYTLEVDVGDKTKTVNGIPITTKNLEVGKKIMLRYIQSPGYIAGLKRLISLLTGGEQFDTLKFRIFP